ncbi:MAG TPA: cupin domain-containing protein [Sporichthyaceae bacterium]|nr:cupin domain-containing protein [Sporichthyaceae bacterium]
MKVGRVLRTGLDADGRSAAVDDRIVESTELPTGRLLTELWAQESFGGLRYWLLTVPADDPAAPARMHATPTLDLGIVLAGHLRLILEDGSSNDLLPGDAFVQTGTVHAWHNPGPDEAVLAVVVLGAA